MHRHRLSGEGGFGPPLPRPAAPQASVGGFVVCWVPPGSPGLGVWQQELYRWAYAQAQAVVQPSILERDLLGAWN